MRNINMKSRTLFGRELKNVYGGQQYQDPPATGGGGKRGCDDHHGINPVKSKPTHLKVPDLIQP